MPLPERRTAIATKLLVKKPTGSQIERLILKSLDSHKAENVVSIDLTGKSDMADRMIVASGTSQRHLASLAEHIVEVLKHAGFDRVPVEGKDTGDWVLVDAGDIIIHIFRPEIRHYYNIEKMWSVPAAQAEVAQ
ncbi:MAG: ribosome silencing factor [Alphaproteobacteria bacterium]|nr:ribosome silencing factor [Alphaproteobacteria bacterium]